MKLHNITRCSMLAAVIAVCAWISVPLGEQAISLQTFAVFLALGVLGGKRGTVTVVVYLLLGAVGVPVFSGFRGGTAVFLGPTGGFLWGFAAAALLYWVLQTHLKPWLCMVLGMLLCYACGTAWYYFMYAQGALWPVLTTCVLPFLLPDAVKLFLAQMLSKRLTQLIR